MPSPATLYSPTAHKEEVPVADHHRRTNHSKSVISHLNIFPTLSETAQPNMSSYHSKNPPYNSQDPSQPPYPPIPPVAPLLPKASTHRSSASKMDEGSKYEGSKYGGSEQDSSKYRASTKHTVKKYDAPPSAFRQPAESSYSKRTEKKHDAPPSSSRAASTTSRRPSKYDTGDNVDTRTVVPDDSISCVDYSTKSSRHVRGGSHAPSEASTVKPSRARDPSRASTHDTVITHAENKQMVPYNDHQTRRSSVTTHAEDKQLKPYEDHHTRRTVVKHTQDKQAMPYSNGQQTAQYNDRQTRRPSMASRAEDKQLMPYNDRQSHTHTKDKELIPYNDHQTRRLSAQTEDKQMMQYNDHQTQPRRSFTATHAEDKQMTPYNDRQTRRSSVTHAEDKQMIPQRSKSIRRSSDKQNDDGQPYTVVRRSSSSSRGNHDPAPPSHRGSRAGEESDKALQPYIDNNRNSELDRRLELIDRKLDALNLAAQQIARQPPPPPAPAPMLRMMEMSNNIVVDGDRIRIHNRITSFQL